MDSLFRAQLGREHDLARDRTWLHRAFSFTLGGMPGVAYVRLDANAAWPATLPAGGK